MLEARVGRRGLGRRCRCWRDQRADASMQRHVWTTDNPLDGALEIGAGRSPTVVRPAEGERHHAGGVVYSVKACGSVTAKAYTLIEVHIEPDGIMPSHRHAAFEEGMHVLDGSVRATLDGETYEATAGSFLIIPWGLPHEIRNTEGSAARLLLLSVPGGVEDYYRAACRPFPDGRAGRPRDRSSPARTVSTAFGSSGSTGKTPISRPTHLGIEGDPEDASFATVAVVLLRWTRSATRSCSSTPGHMQPRSRLMHLHRVFTSWQYRLTIRPPMFRSTATGFTARIHTLAI